MRYKHRNHKGSCVALVSLCSLWMIGTESFAAPKPEPIHIQADGGSFNYKTGVRVLTGHVKAVQGEMHLHAHQLIVKENNQHSIQEILAYGDSSERAHYWTTNKQNPELHAYAEIIQIFPLNDQVQLKQNVYIKQGDNTFKSQLVLYNRKLNTITVPNMPSNQTIIVYNPEAK